jgi:hypothetical protein
MHVISAVVGVGSQQPDSWALFWPLKFCYRILVVGCWCECSMPMMLTPGTAILFSLVQITATFSYHYVSYLVSCMTDG